MSVCCPVVLTPSDQVESDVVVVVGRESNGVVSVMVVVLRDFVSLTIVHSSSLGLLALFNVSPLLLPVILVGSGSVDAGGVGSMTAVVTVVFDAISVMVSVCGGAGSTLFVMLSPYLSCHSSSAMTYLVYLRS